MRKHISLGVLAAIVVAAAIFLFYSQQEYSLRGSFSQNITQQQMDEFARLMSPYSKDIAILQSFPPQFVVVTKGEGKCQSAHSIAEAFLIDWISNISNCEKRQSLGGLNSDVVVR